MYSPDRIDEREWCGKLVECEGSSRTFTDSVSYIPEQWLCDGVGSARQSDKHTFTVRQTNGLTFTGSDRPLD